MAIPGGRTSSREKRRRPTPTSDVIAVSFLRIVNIQVNKQRSRAPLLAGRQLAGWLALVSERVGIREDCRRPSALTHGACLPAWAV